MSNPRPSSSPTPNRCLIPWWPPPRVSTVQVDLMSLSQEQLNAFVADVLGERPFRARQIYTWLHQRGATSFEEMTDLSKALREKLARLAKLSTLTLDLEQRSVDGTIKYRWKTHDGRFIESVYMPSADRRTLCVSSQVGCAMACSFCMTGTMGIKRNLTPGEIVSQIHQVNRRVRQEEGHETLRPLTNLVFMGMGEPLPQLRAPQDRAGHLRRARTDPTSPTGTSPSPPWGWCP